MKLSAGFAALASLILIPGLVALTINTPSGVTECQPQLLQWSGGTSPYYISVIPGGDVSASALKSFDATNATELTWTVDITSGTSITVRAKDSTGAIAYSGEVSVQEGSDTSCVSSSTSVSVSYGSTDTSAEETTYATTATTAGSTTITSSSDDDSSTTSGTSTATSAASSSSSSDNAAQAVSTTYYFAGVIGTLIATLF
ncbi:hypothetical protein CPB85DRAFT_112750 [Mucidula mucida]|nr:hypothetical protein CPB85DRAFT_112750 [Mucidula mucida]